MEATVQIGSQEPSRSANAGLQRIVMSSVIGTAVEWYDFAIYGTATALVFNKLFFPTRGASLSTIVAVATYGVGFLARPVGAAIFGHYGDKIGRKAMLAATIIIMGVGTFLIGLLPTYGQIGVAAPLLLVCLRLLQGIGLGGEWGGAVLMVVENAATRSRGLLGSMVQIGFPVGVLAAVGMFALVSKLPEQELMSWGWRVPFLISILLVGVGLYIRLSLVETPVFRQLKLRDKVATLPVIEILSRHRRPFFIAIGLKISEIAYFSIASVFSISYVTGHLGLPRSWAGNPCSSRAVCFRSRSPSHCSGCWTRRIPPSSRWLLSWQSTSAKWWASASAPPGIRSSFRRVCTTAVALLASRSARRSAAA
jgi:MHS family shikimate/dehydroshikimate transporter-like MFS transporter